MHRFTGCKIKGSTLVEVLVMMIVAGILFLSIMDGLALFTRMQLQQAKQILASSRITEGYYRMESLVGTADSICNMPEGLIVFQNRIPTKLILQDSTLLYATDNFRDTLLCDVGEVRLIEYPAPQSDTVIIGLRTEGTVFSIRFATRDKSDAIYDLTLNRTEQGYSYEE